MFLCAITAKAIPSAWQQTSALCLQSTQTMAFNCVYNGTWDHAITSVTDSGYVYPVSPFTLTAPVRLGWCAQVYWIALHLVWSNTQCSSLRGELSPGRWDIRILHMMSPICDVIHLWMLVDTEQAGECFHCIFSKFRFVQKVFNKWSPPFLSHRDRGSLLV